MLNNHGICLTLVLCVAIVSGCSTSARNVSSPEAYSRNMAEADKLIADGKQDAAVVAYEKIAMDNPVQGMPWSKIAQIKFAQGYYSQAIVAAEETLRRDPASREAKSVMAVGGLRLAVRSLEELRTDAALAGDAKVDAVKLALMLRETLGEPVLESKTGKPAARKPLPSRTPRSGLESQNSPAVPPASVTPASAAPSGRSSNPFGSLQ